MRLCKQAEGDREETGDGSNDEKIKYLPLFQALFPDFTLAKMDDVHYCRYEWYDGSDAPYYY